MLNKLAFGDTAKTCYEHIYAMHVETQQSLETRMSASVSVTAPISHLRKQTMPSAAAGCTAAAAERKRKAMGRKCS